MMDGLFKMMQDIRFWIVWLLLSMFGGLVAYLMIQERDSYLVEENAYYVYEYRDCVNRDSLNFFNVLALQKVKQLELYKNYLEAYCSENKIQYLKFSFMTIPEGTKVYVIKFNKQETLAKVAITSEVRNMTTPPYQEVWVWHEFLSKTKK